MAVFKHPLGGLSDAEISARVEGLYPNLVAALARAAPSPALAELPAAARILAPVDPAELQQWCFDQGWSEGLPIVPPTPAAVERMVAGSARRGGELIGFLPPRGGAATVEQIAVNAVMAGCRPDHMPVLLAATAAMMEPCFNLGAVQPTTHPVAPLLIVHGPIVKSLGINCGSGAFGPSALANAVIGRAIRLVLWNIGGAIPGTIDRSTQGAPSKFSFCIGENAEATPWEPFVVDRGLPADASAVTVYPGEPPHNINDHEHGDAQGILHVAADVLRTLGSNTWFISWGGRKELMLVLSPEHAATVAGSGFSRRDAQKFLYQAISRRRDELALGGMYHMRDWPCDLNERTAPDALIPEVPRPEDILILVAGGTGRHSAALPSFGCSVSVTRKI
jgi:hypothetical protein